MYEHVRDGSGLFIYYGIEGIQSAHYVGHEPTRIATICLVETEGSALCIASYGRSQGQGRVSDMTPSELPDQWKAWHLSSAVLYDLGMSTFMCDRLA